MQGKKPKLKRQEIENMWHIYWRYKLQGIRPHENHSDYPFYMYADYLLRTEKYQSTR